MRNPDPSTTYERLRAETAEMFDYDLASASLTQGLQIDLVSLLRLEIDAMSGRVLAGETVDLTRLVAAHGLLRQMLPERALVAPAPPPEARFGTEHRERLRKIIEKTLLADDTNKAERMADIAAREEMAALAAADTAPAPVAPPPPVTLPPPADNVVPLDVARAAERAADERAWRAHVYGNGGALIAPAWTPPDERRR